MTIYDVINKWDLNTVPLDLNRYSRSVLNLLAKDIEICYLQAPNPSSGRIHQSLHTATAIAEATSAIERLALPLVFSRQIILPDPLFSILSRKANSTWQRLPESGNRSFSDSPLIHSNWKTYWSTKIEDRVKYLNECLPVLVNRLLKLKDLVHHGFIVLQPWEPLVDAEIPNIKKTIVELKKDGAIVNEVTERFTQDKYHLGARIGALGIVASSDHPSTGLKKGSPLWVGDKTEILLMGLIHSLIAQRLSSNFMETLPGDRVVFDFIRSGGMLNPGQKTIIPSVKVPNLSNALWEEIVAIRKDSELLATFQEIISELAYVSEGDQSAVLIERIAEIESKLKEDASLKKFVKLPFAELGVGTIVGLGSKMMAGTAFPPALAAGAAAAVGKFLFKLASDYFSKESAGTRKRRDLVIKIKESIA